MVQKSQAGIAHILAILLVLVTLFIGIVGFRVVAFNHHASSPAGKSSKTTTTTDSPLYLKSIGFNLDDYDPATGRAGDMVFTHVDNNLSQSFNKIFADFGTQDPRDPNDASKRNPQPVYILPLGTKVRSLVDGKVAKVEGLYSGDATIWVTANGRMDSGYIYETEHIINPVVKVGDSVRGGQAIGEVSRHDSQYHPGFGVMEIGILHPDQTRATHICPFHYLDSSIKHSVQNQILGIHKAWMEYTGLPNLYDDSSASEPGCSTLDPVAG